jgi:nicotinate-nucleotide adenylyltransferase
MPQVDFSSRELRARLAAGKSIRYRTPRPVERYLEETGLYRSAH